ncbi:MAG: hypothetical protein OXD48_08565, partial [Litoreibacter sp.]|nr:hypothetical protein [Litoreibacter sp.]
TWFVLKSYRAGEAWHNATIFAVGFMIATAPGALQQLQFQIGRFDAFGLAILCAVFAITRRSTSPFSLALVTGALVLAILIHEAHFFWVVPLSLWLWFFHGDATKSRTVPLLVISIVTLGAVLIAGTSSYSDYIAFADIKTELSQRSDIPIKDGSLRVQFRSLDDNVTLSAKHNFTFRSIVSFMLGLASLIPYVALLLLAVTAHDRKKSSWALLAACAPLLLVVAGYDQGRWVAMANVSLCLVVIAALSNVRIMPRQAMVLLPLAVLASLCQIFLGPTGDVLSYPYIMRFI